MNGWIEEGKVRNERVERGRKREKSIGGERKEKRELNGWREEGKVRNERIQREGEKEIIKGRREGRMN